MLGGGWMGLVTNSFLRLTAMERGFDPERLFVVDFGLTMKEYRTRPLREAFIYETIRRIRELPAVEASTPSIGTPLLGIKGNRFVAEANDRSDKTIGALEIFDIQPEYFHIVGIEIKKGRNFDATDSRSSELVGIIDQRSASRSWPGEDPIGKRFRSRSDGPWITVVGVVQSVKTDTYVNDDGYLQAYLPLTQEENWLNVHVVIKRRGQAFLNPEAVREKVKAVNGKIVVERIARLDELYSAMFESALVTPRFYLLLFTSLALAACTIAAIGIYAALSYSTKQREGEMGIRIALGASPAHVRNLVFIEMLACVAYGIGGGFVILSWSSSVIRSILYGLPNNDPVTIFAVLLTILAISGLAAYLPARRASNVDPAITIRNGSA
jgi:hypothetical protein